MTIEIRLLGSPVVLRDGTSVPPPRGNKSWAVLAYLLLSPVPVSRTRLESLLFSEADDPLGALIADLEERAARLGMRELLVRAHLHRRRLGGDRSLEVARSLAAEIDNPALERALAG